MTLTDSLLPSAFTPPSEGDPRDWLDGQVDELAARAGAFLENVVAEATGRFMATLTAAGDVAQLGSIAAEWSRFVTMELSEWVGGMYLGGSLTAYFGASAQGPIPEGVVAGWAPIVNDRALDYQRAATNRLVGVGERTWGKVRTAVVKSIEAGQDPRRLATTLQQQVAMSQFRANAIARTETVGAYVNGDRLGAEALGDFGPIEHKWLAARDRRTRATHIEANGQVKPFKEPFHVGDALMLHPHESGAPAREVVNCRCVEQHLYAGDVRPDGSIVAARSGRLAPVPTEGG